jgi:hypothetical protein
MKDEEEEEMDMSDDETPAAKKAASKRRRIDNDKLKVETKYRHPTLDANRLLNSAPRI